MIFKELADLVLLAVNGGKFASESAVQRSEVNSYVPVVAHYALQEQVFRLHQDRRAERSSAGFAGTLLDGSYYTTFILDVTQDTLRNSSYLELPGVAQSIPGMLAIESVFPKSKPSESYAIVNGPSGALGMSDVMPCCWHEIHSDKTRIYFDGIPNDACDIVVRACMEISPDLGETTLAIPRAYEQRIIAYCLEHFRGQRQSPADGLLDNQDINAVTDKQSQK